MPTVRHYLIVLVLLLIPAAPLAQQSVIPDAVRAAADRITSQQLARDLEYLASDELLGRNTPSPGYDKAAEYIAQRLEKARWKPAGDGGGYFQRYTMRESHADTSAAYLEAGSARLRFGEDFVLRSFAGAITGSRPAVYVGHGWTIPAKGIDPFAGVDVKDKIVVAHGPRALPKGIEQVGRVVVGATSPMAEAHTRGALAVIYIPQAGGPSNWEQMRGQNTVTRELVSRVPSAYEAQPLTSVMISRAATASLFSG